MINYDLFTYPRAPGFKQRTTSRDAARLMMPRAPVLRERILDEIRAAGPAGLTADEAADRVGATVLASRPRLTELAKAGKIVPTGARRPNESHVAAKVWKCPE